MDRNQNPDAPVYIHPDVAAPATDAYTAGIRARRAGALPKVSVPVAGGQGPQIPRLDGPPMKGRTMEQQAQYERPSAPVAQQHPGGIIDGGVPRQGPQRPQQLNISPADVLPKEAAADPDFMQGMGSMMAASQPHLAAKYGVYRNGHFIPPQKLIPEGRAQLRPETMRDLEALNALQQGAAVSGLDANDAAAERAVASRPVGAAATIGNVPGDRSNQPLSEEERHKLNETVSKMDEFDFDSFRQSMMKDILNNPEQKKIIEDRLVPLDLTDMITTMSVRQEIPVKPGQFWFVLRSMTGEEDLEVKRLIMMESKGLEVSDRYLLDKYAFMSMAVGLVSVNTKQFGDVYAQDGVFNDELFWKKFRNVLRLPLHMLATIGLNQLWFEQRVRKLFVAEKVGNG